MISGSNEQLQQELEYTLLKWPHMQITFLKFTSCDNKAFVGCIPIPAVAVHLNLKS